MSGRQVSATPSVRIYGLLAALHGRYGRNNTAVLSRPRKLMLNEAVCRALYSTMLCNAFILATPLQLLTGLLTEAW